MSGNTNRPRLRYLASRDRTNTVVSQMRALRSRGIDAASLPYEKAFSSHFLPSATYLFTDFDRLSPSEHRGAAQLYNHLKAHGQHVVNNPGLIPSRDEFITRMKKTGLSDFTVFRPACFETPDRFPVFLRTNAGHRGTLSDLLYSPDACEAAIEAALKKGNPLSDLLFIEYAAEPSSQSGHFQKHAAYRVGDKLIPAPTVNDKDWVAKIGTANSATAQQYADEYAQLDAFPHMGWVERVFDQANAEFGRVDFGIYKGRPQAFELNTNPRISLDSDHENADRRKTLATISQRLTQALSDLATVPNRGPIPLKHVFWRKGFPRRLKRI